MTRSFLKILLIFVLGALGGLWAQIYLLPYLAGLDYFHDFQFVKMIREREMIIYPKTETFITVQENQALQQMVERVAKTVVGVKSKTKEGRTLQGSGLIVTSDGLLVTLAELVPQGSDFFFSLGEEWPAYQILKRDFKNNLALVKIGAEGLATAGFSDLAKKKLGERVSLVSAAGVVNEGIIRKLEEGSIQTNILESAASGSPLFDIAGNVVGLATVEENGRVSAIPIDIIRKFTGL